MENLESFKDRSSSLAFQRMEELLQGKPTRKKLVRPSELEAFVLALKYYALSVYMQGEKSALGEKEKEEADSYSSLMLGLIKNIEIMCADSIGEKLITASAKLDLAESKKNKRLTFSSTFSIIQKVQEYSTDKASTK